MYKLIWIVAFFLMHSQCYAQKLYSAVGHASYYANKFNGRKTASGEIFSNSKMTAAHLTLPFGTMVRVTNLKNNKSVIVTINDRGPYIKKRIIDLSRRAADSLEIIHSGWAMVKVEQILPEPVVTKTDTATVLLSDSGIFKFPHDWIGNWTGHLKIYSAVGLKKIIPMQLHIANLAPDRYQWTITYDTMPRDYELVLRDSTAGLYSIDEKNGIDITSYLLGNHFVSRFAVDGSLLNCEYYLMNRDEMIFEITSGSSDPNWTTGNVVLKEDSIPAVSVYAIRNLQKAVLYREK